LKKSCDHTKRLSQAAINIGVFTPCCFCSGAVSLPGIEPKNKRAKMVEVFATNVQEATEAKKVVALLARYFPGTKINFDLQDCDKILRVEGKSICPSTIMQLVNETGFACNVLE
jgi:hypothetical protein